MVFEVPDRFDLPAPAERNWAVASHLGALVGWMFAFGQLAVPLLIWLLKRDQSDFVAENARESLNFQLSVTLYGVVAAVLIYVLIGFVVIGLLVLLELVCVIVASLQASRGEVYRYPLTLRLIS